MYKRYYTVHSTVVTTLCCNFFTNKTSPSSNLFRYPFATYNLSLSLSRSFLLCDYIYISNLV